ncbi:hypothetical protein IF1G_01992 [Cordyceps javanica]|uniref:Cell wall protein n=1 Tax=Cordyceps javanica TaxID=43265 RepID=A0A545VDH3_9HYPO|nr:hypothetical protein IF1G_01992 [Cordyceps javanica]TQW10552.1 hypothetical protein IF2G_01494 [Cordyceps javanica]
MKVSTASLFLTSLCGSALAAPITGDVKADISVAAADATGSVEARGLVEGLPVQTLAGATPLGSLAGASDPVKVLGGALGQPGGVLGRDNKLEASVVVNGADEELVGADARGKVNARAAVQPPAPAGNVASVDGIVSQATGAADKVTDADLAAELTRVVKEAVGSLGTRAVLPGNIVPPTAADAGASVPFQSAVPGAGAVGDVDSVNTQVQEILDQLKGEIDEISQNVSPRDLVGGDGPATGDIYTMSPEVQQFIDQLKAEIEHIRKTKSARDLVGGSGAPTAPTTGDVSSLTPEVQHLVQQLEAEIADVAKTVSVRGLADGTPADPVTSAVKGATGINVDDLVGDVQLPTGGM